MSIIEFQMKSSNFLALFRERLKRIKFCKTDIGSQSMIINRIEVESNGTSLRDGGSTKFMIRLQGMPHSPDVFETINGKRLRVAQKVKIFLTNVSDLETANTNPVNVETVLPLTFLFDIILSPDSADPFNEASGVMLRIRYHDVEGNVTDDIKNKIRSLIPEQSTALPLAGMVGLSGENSIANAGITCINLQDPKSSIVSMRVEIGIPPVFSDAWKDFFNGNIADNIKVQGSNYPESEFTERGWSLFIDQGILTHQIKQQMEEELNSNDDFHLKWGPTATWSNSKRRAMFTLTFNGDAVNACQCIFWNIDVNVDLTMLLELKIPQNNVLRKEFNIINIDKNDLQLLCCEISAALLWPYIGAKLLNSEVSWDKYILGLALGPALVFIAAIIDASNRGYDNVPKKCQHVSDTQFFCDKSFEQGDPIFGRQDLLDCVGLEKGLLLLGVQDVPETANVFLKSDVSGFEWIPLSVPCSDMTPRKIQDIKRKPFDFIFATAKVNLSNIGTNSGTTGGQLLGNAPLYLCDVLVLDDPLNVFKNIQKFGTIDEFNIIVQFPYPSAAYFANPYDCKILIKTNGGARLITIPAPIELTIDQAQAIVNTMIREQSECHKAISDWFRLFKRYNPKWSVDPSPRHKNVEHFWNVTVLGLNPGEQISMVDHLDNKISFATSDTSGIVQFNTIVSPILSGSEISLVRSGSIIQGTMTTPELQEQRIYTHQVLLSKESVIHLITQCERLSGGIFQGERILFAVTSKGLNVYTLSVPAFPKLIRQFRLHGMRGVINWNNKLLAWGSFGLMLLPNRNVRMNNLKCEQPKEVLDIAVWDHNVYVLLKDELEIYDKNLCKVNELSLKDGNYLAVVGETLVVGHQRELSFYSLENRDVPKQLGAYEVPKVTGLIRPTIENNTLFVRHTKTSGCLVDLSNVYEPREVVNYERNPWFVDAVQIDNKTLARLDPERKSVSIYNTERTLTT